MVVTVDRLSCENCDRFQIITAQFREILMGVVELKMIMGQQSIC